VKKTFACLLIIVSSLWAAQIDTRLYEAENLLSYYDQIEIHLEQNATTDEAIERIKSEKTLLGKLRSLATRGSSIDIEIDLSILEKEEISEQEYMESFELLARAMAERQKLERNQMFIQEKLSYLKKQIEKTTNPLSKNLQLYQLQFAYYKLKQSNDDMLIRGYTILIEDAKKDILEAIARVTFDESFDFVALESELKKIEQKLVAYNLTKEREMLSQDQISNELQDKLKSAQKEKDEKLKALFDAHLIEALSAFQDHNIPKTISLQQTLSSLTEMISSGKTVYQMKLELHDEMVKENTNILGYIVPSFQEFFKSTSIKLSNFLVAPFVVLDETPISAMSLFKAIGIFILGFLVAKLYFWILTWFYKKRKDISMVWLKVIANVGFILILFISLVVAIASIGLSVTNLAVIAGVLSIGLGFALKSVVSSMISGMILLSENYIKIGDYIRINDQLTGKVTDIGLRASVLKTIDNIDIVIPNNELTDNQVVNLTLDNRIRRIYVPFKVGYGADIKQVKSIIVEAVMQSKIKLLREPLKYKPNVWMRHMSDSFIELDLLVWIEGLRPSTPSNLLILIYETLQKNNIDMPYPQLDLHLKNPRILPSFRKQL